MFERPAGAPADAAYVVYKRLAQADGTIAWAVLDQAALDPQTGQVTTRSPPYPGVDGSGDLFAMLVYAAGPHALTGFITGTVRRATRAAGATAPLYVPVAGATVSAVGLDGRPLYQLQSGATVAISQADGTFALLDQRYKGGQIVVSAEVGGQFMQATAFEAEPQDSTVPEFVRNAVKNVATVNLTFAASEPAPAAPTLSIRPFVTGSDGALVELTSATVTVGAALTFKLAVTQAGSPIPSASAQQAALTVEPDPTVTGTGSYFQVRLYLAAQPGTLFVTASVSGVTVTTALRVVAPGGTTRDALPNDPPAVIDSATVPKRNATGVQPTAVLQLSFTEPVTHVTAAAVRLTDGSGAILGLTMSGAGLTGPLDDVGPNAIVTGLTLQPTIPLDYGTTYTLTLTSDIRDTDVDPVTGEPMGKPLAPYTTTFTTFQPTLVGQTDDTFTGGGLAVVDDRAYVAQNQGMFTTVRLFDVSDPTVPTEIAPNLAGGKLLASPPITNLGHPADLRVQDQSPVLNNTGRLMALALTNYAIPYPPSNLYLYDVSSDQTWSWAGAVTLGTDPLDGLVRRIRLKDGYVYAATTGIGKGIQVVDLAQAASLFATQTADGEGSPDYLDMQRRLGLAGQGFSQAAIVQTIPVRETGLDTSPTLNNMSVVLDLDVVDLTVDGAAQSMVVATGRQGFTVANPLTGQLLWNGRPVNASGAEVLGWGTEVAAATINNRPLAAVLGYGPGAGAGTTPLHVVIMDLSNARHPVAIGDVVVPGVTPGLYADLILQDDRVYIGGDTATTVIAITDPAHPEILGTIAGLAGRLSFPQKNLLFSNAVAWTDQQSVVGGIRTATFARIAYMATPPPAVTRTLASDTTGKTEETVQDVPITVRVLPPPAPSEVQAASVQLIDASGLFGSIIQLVSDGVTRVATLVKGFQKPAGALLSAIASITVGGETITTPAKPLRMGSVKLLVDANNDRDVTDADEQAQRDGKIWRFWQAGRNASPMYSLDASDLEDFATVRLQVAVPVGTLRLRLAGSDQQANAALRWGAGRKVGAGLEYLFGAGGVATKAQVGQLNRGCDSRVGGRDLPGPGGCEANGSSGLFLQNVPVGQLDLLVRCTSCPIDPTRKLVLEVLNPIQVWEQIASLAVDIRPLNEWMTVYTAHQAGSDRPKAVLTPVPGWKEIPTIANNITVLIHGFRDSEDSAANSVFPTMFRRLYWASYPVLSSEPDFHYLAGIAWPADVDFVTSLNFPDAEFRALETGVPVAALLSQLRSSHSGTLDIVAHSLGALVANSAIEQLPAHIVDSVTMLDAAVSVEAFSANYQPSPIDKAIWIDGDVGAQAAGYPDDVMWGIQWDQIVASRGTRRNATFCLVIGDCRSWYQLVADQFPTPVSDAQLKSFFVQRWTKGVNDSPWTGLFAQNLTKTRLFNFFNPVDQLLIANGSGVGWWATSQLRQKPQGSDDMDRSLSAIDPSLFWLDLKHTDVSEQEIWGSADVFTADQSARVRKWAELAFWFQPVSPAAGANALTDVGSLDVSDIAGDGGVLTDYTSHTYPTGRPVSVTKKLYQDLANLLKASVRSAGQ